MQDRAKRIQQTQKKKEKKKSLIKTLPYTTFIGYMEEDKDYFKPSSKCNNKKDYKRISNKKLRQRLRRELEKDPESLNSGKNNKEQKNFDYWWTID